MRCCCCSCRLYVRCSSSRRSAPVTYPFLLSPFTCNISDVRSQAQEIKDEMDALKAAMLSGKIGAVMSAAAGGQGGRAQRSRSPRASQVASSIMPRTMTHNHDTQCWSATDNTHGSNTSQLCADNPHRTESHFKKRKRKLEYYLPTKSCPRVSSDRSNNLLDAPHRTRTEAVALGAAARGDLGPRGRGTAAWVGGRAGRASRGWGRGLVPRPRQSA